jgi:methionine synthase II (cobalamin-independent)
MIPEFEDRIQRYYRNEMSPEDGEQVLAEAAAAAIKEQMDLGIDEWTGGEYYAYGFIARLHERLTGVKIDKPEADVIIDYIDVAHGLIVGDIEAPDGLGYADAYRRESALPGGVRKATAVGLSSSCRGSGIRLQGSCASSPT